MDEVALERLIIDNAAFEQLNAAMDVFCPFDAVGMTQQEVKHARFLQYVLDPARPHGFGDACLRAFMRSVATTLADAKLGFTPLDVHLMELDGAVVHRERDSIDLLIEVAQSKLVIAIELKINASEHSGQLGKYRKTVEREFPAHKRLLLFLTKRGEAPSADGQGWHALSLKPVADAMQTVVDRQVGAPDAQMMLAAYVAMLRREHLTDERLDRLAASLWREHREALDFLMERRPDTKYGLLAPLLDRHEEVANALSKTTELNIVPEYSTKSQVFFGVADWDGVPGMLPKDKGGRRMVTLLLQEYKGVLRAQFQLRPGENRKAVFDKLRAANADIGGSHAIGTSYRQLANISIAAPDGGQLDRLSEIIDQLANFVNSNKLAYGAAMADLAA